MLMNRREEKQEERAPEHGYEHKNRRREEAIVVQQIMSERLNNVGWCHMTKFYDVANAFNPLGVEQVDEIAKKGFEELDGTLLETLYRDPATVIHACDRKSMFQHGSGSGPQGFTGGPKLFNETYWKAIEPITKNQIQNFSWMCARNPCNLSEKCSVRRLHLLTMLVRKLAPSDF